MVVPTRGPLDQVRRILQGHHNIVRGSNERGLGYGQFCNTFAQATESDENFGLPCGLGQDGDCCASASRGRSAMLTRWSESFCGSSQVLNRLLRLS